MLCIRCGKKNHYKANYCINCCYNFNELERDKNYKKTFYYKWNIFDKWYKRFKLDAITQNIFFRILVIVVILYLGLINIYRNGNVVAIQEDPKYKIVYNDKSQEYYLLVGDGVEEVALNLYIPNNTDDIEIDHYNEDDKLLEKKKYKEGEEIIITTYDSDYFILNSKYDDQDSSKLRLSVYNENMVEEVK